MTTSPVLFLVFNRPKHTEEVIEEIRRARPPKLYVAADGPRCDREGEVHLCEEVRRIATNVDWSCQVRTLFRQSNLGCKEGVSSAITWFFDKEELGIVLEDDCVPHPDFFEFCDVLLERYASDERVWAITGDNFQEGGWRGEASYYFSRYNHCWGWATWRRAWQCYEGVIPFWPEWKGSRRWRETLPDPVERRYWSWIFQRVFRGEIDSWAYPWTACVWYHGGLTATPNKNLVTNIGFGPSATHTKPTVENKRVPTDALASLTHPVDVVRNVEADRFTFDNHFNGKTLRWPRRGIVLAVAGVKWFWKRCLLKHAK